MSPRKLSSGIFLFYKIMIKKFKAFLNWLWTWILLQFTLGPVFFFIINLALQRTMLDGIVWATAVALVDLIYINLSILGIGKLLERKKIKKIFGIVSPLVLAVFGIFIISTAIVNSIENTTGVVTTATLFASFISVFSLTITSPMTIIVYKSLFSTKALEYNYSKKELFMFGWGTGLATFLFMSSAVLIISIFKGSIPSLLIVILNCVVWGLLIVYGVFRLVKGSQS